MSKIDPLLYDNRAIEKELERCRKIGREKVEADIKMRQAELNARHELIHQKERDKTNLNWLAGFLIIGTALIILVGFAKYQNEQAAQQKEQELKQTIECK